MMAMAKPAVLLFIVLIAIAFESTCDPSIDNSIIPNLDKIIHFLVFGVVGWLLAILLSAGLGKHVSKLNIFLISLLLVLLLGSGDEWIQSFTLTRHAEMNDVLADVAGGIVFLLVYFRSNACIFSKKEACKVQVVDHV